MVCAHKRKGRSLLIASKKDILLSLYPMEPNNPLTCYEKLYPMEPNIS
jgi:hypothetical protein